jgi:hypothetical protein
MADRVQQAISSFAMLPLTKKLETLAAAAIQVESALEKNDRMLSHPGDRPWDYRAAVESAMLGLGPALEWIERDDLGALVAGGCPASRFLRRAGISLTEKENEVLSEFTGVIASAVPANDFACIIDGHEHLPETPAGLGFPEALRKYGLFAKMLQASKVYKKVFVGSFSFVDVHSADIAIMERIFFAGVSYVKKSFRYADADILVYAAGVEFPC